MLQESFSTAFFYFFFLAPILSQGVEINIEDLDKYVEQARVQWNVPGMSVAVVHKGEVVLSKGYGKSSIEDIQPVNEETLFMIGSTTKAMTAVAMAMLVDEGKVSWTDKVTDHLEWFKLSDPYVTRELTIQDLFTHNSGLGNSDLLWVLWDYSTEEIVRRIAKQPLSYSLRGGYTYQNIMYATAGLVIEKASKENWDSFIHERIFEPLGMTRSCALKACATSYKNRSKPHYPTDNGIIQIIDSNADSIASAGSVWSCVKDMSKWMQFILDEGTVDGKELISRENFDFINSPKIIIPKKDFYPTAQLTKPHFTAYSLGWFNHDYKGEYIQFHTGSLNGSGAIIGLIPDQELGVYVMVNLDHAEVRHAIMYKVFDYLLGLGHRDWSLEVKNLYDRRAERSLANRRKVFEKRHSEKPLTITYEEIVGTYSNELLGNLKVDIQNNQLLITCREDRHIILSHWHYNTFLGKIFEYEHDQGDLIDFNRSAQDKLSFSLYGHDFKKID